MIRQNLGSEMERTPGGVPISDLDPFTVEAIREGQNFDGMLREMAPVIYLPQYDIWVVGRHADVHAIAGDWRNYSSASRPFHDPASIRPEILLNFDPPEHARVRAVIQKVLAPAVMNRMRDAFVKAADELVDRLLADGAVDVNGHVDVAAAYVLKAFTDAIGLPKEGRQHLLHFSDAVFNTFGPPNDIFRRGVERGADAIAYVETNCKRETLAPGGLGAAMYEAVDRGTVTEEEAELLVKTMYAAGADTTILGIGSLLRAFAEFPAQWEILKKDPSLSRQAFEEILRYECPARFGGRITSREVEIAGLRVPSGARMMMLWMAAGRDPRRWEHADKYDLNRKLNGHVGMGYGIHACVGQSLARLEGECMFAALARKVDRIELLGEPEPAINMAAHGYEKLPIRLHPA
jgi:4-methoxybenzoate monooxygenase (O-demethylating)